MNWRIFIKLGNTEFFRWLDANLWSKVQNAKFQIQNDCQTFEKLKNVNETRQFEISKFQILK